MKKFAFVLMFLALGASAAAKNPSLKEALASGTYLEIPKSPLVRFEMRYATANNFTGKKIYTDLRSCYLHKEAAEKLKRATEILAKEKPGYSLLIFDCLRPRSVQRTLFALVKGTDKEPYVADPETGSVHNFGFAVDLTLADAKGKELDMGTPFDDFRDLAQPVLEEKYLKEGKLTEAQVANRRVLRRAMEGAGFIQFPIEWWHYDARPKPELQAGFPLVE